MDPVSGMLLALIFAVSLDSALGLSPVAHTTTRGAAGAAYAAVTGTPPETARRARAARKARAAEDRLGEHRATAWTAGAAGRFLNGLFGRGGPRTITEVAPRTRWTAIKDGWTEGVQEARQRRADGVDARGRIWRATKAVTLGTAAMVRATGTAKERLAAGVGRAGQAWRTKPGATGTSAPSPADVPDPEDPTTSPQQDPTEPAATVAADQPIKEETMTEPTTAAGSTNQAVPPLHMSIELPADGLKSLTAAIAWVETIEAELAKLRAYGPQMQQQMEARTWAAPDADAHLESIAEICPKIPSLSPIIEHLTAAKAGIESGMAATEPAAAARLQGRIEDWRQ